MIDQANGRDSDLMIVAKIGGNGRNPFTTLLTRFGLATRLANAKRHRNMKFEVVIRETFGVLGGIPSGTYEVCI